MRIFNKTLHEDLSWHDLLIIVSLSLYRPEKKKFSVKDHVKKNLMAWFILLMYLTSNITRINRHKYKTLYSWSNFIRNIFLCCPCKNQIQ